MEPVEIVETMNSMMLKNLNAHQKFVMLGHVLLEMVIVRLVQLSTMSQTTRRIAFIVPVDLGKFAKKMVNVKNVQITRFLEHLVLIQVNVSQQFVQMVLFKQTDLVFHATHVKPWARIRKSVKNLPVDQEMFLLMMVNVLSVINLQHQFYSEKKNAEQHAKHVLQQEDSIFKKMVHVQIVLNIAKFLLIERNAS